MFGDKINKIIKFLNFDENKNGGNKSCIINKASYFNLQLQQEGFLCIANASFKYSRCAVLNADELFPTNRALMGAIQARQIAMYFAKSMTKSSLSNIGSHCGGKDHATVLHACRTMNNLMETDKKYKGWVNELQKKINVSTKYFFSKIGFWN